MQLAEQMSQGQVVRAPRLMAAYLPRAGVVAAEFSVVLAEALAVAVFGSRLSFHHIGSGRWGFALAVAAGYAALAALQRAVPQPGRSSNTGPAIRCLAGSFICYSLLEAEPIAQLGWEASVVLLWFAASAASVVAVRNVAMDLAERFPGLMPMPSPAVVVGSGEQAVALYESLKNDPAPKYQLIGFFDDRNTRHGPLGAMLPYLGDIRSLTESVSKLRVQNVYVAMSWAAGPRIAGLLEKLRYLPIAVRLLPEHIPPALPSKTPHSIEGIVMPTLMLPPFSETDLLIKRSFDFVAACILFVLMLPLFAVVSLLIRLDSRGGVFFRQARTGRYGSSFQIIKFRSLHVAQADDRAEKLVSAGDRRVTRVGRYLRKYSIDELPQILNVIMGDMSLVGPRPHAPRAKADGQIYAEVMADYPLRYRVRPGMTGWAQVNGWRGNTDTIEKLHRRVEYDFHYIENWSMRLDLYILLRTVPSVIAPPADNA